MVLVPNTINIIEVEFLDNHQYNDDEFYKFCMLNDHLKFERDSFGNIFIVPNTGGTTGIKNSDLIIDLGIWNRKIKWGKFLIPQLLFDCQVQLYVPLMRRGFQMNAGMN